MFSIRRGTEEDAFPIQNIEPLDNGNLIKKNMLGKSRAMGF